MMTENTFDSKPDYVDIVSLVRSIQRVEGNIDCYRRGLESCNLMDCAWRDHCIKEPEETSKVDSESHKQKKSSESETGK